MREHLWCAFLAATADPLLWDGCDRRAGPGPEYFVVPVPGGSLRAPICARHGKLLTDAYALGAPADGRPLSGASMTEDL